MNWGYQIQAYNTENKALHKSKMKNCYKTNRRNSTAHAPPPIQCIPLHQTVHAPQCCTHGHLCSPGSHLWWGWGRGMLVVPGEGWGSSCIREVERAWETTLSFCLRWNLLTMVCRCYYSPVLCYLKTGRAE